MFFLINNFYSQQANSKIQIMPAIIVLKGGAKVYSADESFNQQILSNKGVLTNSVVFYQEDTGKECLLSLIAKQSSKEEKKDLKHQLKIAESKRQKEVLKLVKKEIVKFEKKIQVFVKHDFNGVPFSNHFFSSISISKNYVLPVQNNRDFFKFYISRDAYLVRHALDFLHSQKYTYYNNKSIDFCFSKVFSVRPPPVLV